MVTATTHAALVAALAHEKEAHLDRSRMSAGRGSSQNGCSGSTDIAGVIIQLKASVIAAKDADDNARLTLVSAKRALDLAKSYHEEAIGRLNEAVGSFKYLHLMRASAHVP